MKFFKKAVESKEAKERKERLERMNSRYLQYIQPTKESDPKVNYESMTRQITLRIPSKSNTN